MRSMSFNLLCANVTKERAAAVIETIKKYDPDTVGVQEATPQWMDILRSCLTGYEFIGKGREPDGSGEYSAIGYKRSVFELIKTETRWLSDTPNIASKVEGSLCLRVYTYVTLKCKKCGKTITYVNTHFDHAEFLNSENTVRKKQAEYLSEFIKSLGNTYVILSGDFNSLPQDLSINEIKSSGLSNCSETATVSDTTPTFENYTIDYIFAYKSLTDVSEYHVCYDKINGEFPSDHRPIFIDYKFK